MGPSPQDINFKAKSMKKDTWDPKKALEEQTAYFAEKKAAKKAVEEDQADKMAANINVEGRLTEEGREALLSDTGTFSPDEVGSWLDTLKKRFETDPDSITEKELKEISLSMLRELRDSLVNKEESVITIDEDMINLLNKVITQKEDSAKKGGGFIHSNTFYGGPNTHA